LAKNLLPGHPQRDPTLYLSRAQHTWVDRHHERAGVVGSLQQAVDELVLKVPEPNQTTLQAQ
jgi:hypothetical protein